MKERPILMSGAMVRALLDGNKTQTRRVINPQPVHSQHHEHRGKIVYDGEHRMWCWKDLALENIWDFPNGEDRKLLAEHCPYGQPSDRLWVREAWRVHESANHVPPRDLPHAHVVHYEADGTPHREFGKYRPPMFMPRWASRITLEIISVRVERLQDISEDDALAEGINVRELIVGTTHEKGYHEEIMGTGYYADANDDSADGFGNPEDAYAELWEQINGAGSWALNPFCWVIEFNRVTA